MSSSNIQTRNKGDLDKYAKQMTSSTFRTTTARTTTRRQRKVSQGSAGEIDLVHVISSVKSSVYCHAIFVYLPFLLCMITTIALKGCLQVQTEIIHPYLATLEFTKERAEWEGTYPRMECSALDLTTNSATDLVAQLDQVPNQSHPLAESVSTNKVMNVLNVKDATEKAIMHGAVVLPNLLQQSTTRALRKYVLKRNNELSQEDQLDVIANDFRISFAPSVLEDPSIRQAMYELGTNIQLKQILQAVLGIYDDTGSKKRESCLDPSIMELQVITSWHAESQFWHADTPPEHSATRYSDTFVPLYTLLIPLQPTNTTMGPTALCPGSHRCHYMDRCTGIPQDDDVGFSPLLHHNSKHGAAPYWKAGDGLLYSSTTQHRGGEHKEGPPRVALLVSWSVFDGKRLPPLDTVFGIRPNQLGWTFSQLKAIGAPDFQSTNSELWWDAIFGSRPGWTLYRLYTVLAANDKQYRFTVDDLKLQMEEKTGVIGRMSSLLWVTVQDPPRGYKATEYHLRRVLQRLHGVCWIASIFMACLSYWTCKKSNRKRLMSTTAIIAMLLWTISIPCTSTLDKDLFHHVKPLTKPANVASTTTQLIRASAVPHIHDILVAPAASTFVQNHPGNKLFWSLIQQHAQVYSWDYRNRDKHLLSNFLNFLLSLSTQGKHDFLQLTDANDWISLHPDAAKSLVHNALLHFFWYGTLHFQNGAGMPEATRSLRHDLIVSMYTAPIDETIEVSRKWRTKEQTFSLGQIVEAQMDYGNSRKWIRAKIHSVRSPLYVDLKHYDIEQSVQEGVHLEFVRNVPNPRYAAAKSVGRA